MLSAVVSADGGHLVGGPGHAESVRSADALSIWLADAEPDEIQTAEIIQTIGVKITRMVKSYSFDSFSFFATLTGLEIWPWAVRTSLGPDEESTNRTETRSPAIASTCCSG